MTHESPLSRVAVRLIEAGSSGTNDLPLIVLVHPRPLIGDCFVAGLQSADQAIRFRSYRSVADWRAADYQSTSLVLLHLPTRVSGAVAFDLDESIAFLKACEPAPAFAFISDSEEVGHIMKYLGKGARGYIPTSLSLLVATQALRLINAGGVFIPSACLAERTAQPVKPTFPASPGKTALSPKEIAVARALRKGTPNKIIAYDLGMCESTVKVHVRNIMKKLKAKNRTEAAMLVDQMFGGAESRLEIGKEWLEAA